jgi:hypothetical protein
VLDFACAEISVFLSIVFNVSGPMTDIMELWNQFEVGGGGGYETILDSF